MSDWDSIKNNIGELNGINKLSPIDKKPLDNELIMCLFCNKINLKYRYKPYYEVPFIDYTTRIFNTIINLKNINFFKEASNDSLIKTYVNSIKNTLDTQLYTFYKNINKKVNLDINLLLISAIDNLDMKKYKILSEMLYKIDSKYLDYAKESIINSNKNQSLDKMLYNTDMPEKTNIESFISINNLHINYFLILIMILICVIIFYRFVI